MPWYDNIPPANIKQASNRIRANFAYLYDQLAAFPSYLKTNDKFGLRGSIADLDSGNIIRSFFFDVVDGTNEGTIKVRNRSARAYNTGILPTVDNIGKGDDGTYYQLSSLGTTLYIKKAALGIPTDTIYYCISHSLIYQQSDDTYYRSYLWASSNYVACQLKDFPPHASVDITSVVSGSKMFSILCCIITSG